MEWASTQEAKLAPKGAVASSEFPAPGHGTQSRGGPVAHRAVLAVPSSPVTPDAVDELPPRPACTDDPERREEMLLSIVPRNPRHVYKMRAIIEAIADRDADGTLVLRDRAPVG